MDCKAHKRLMQHALAFSRHYRNMLSLYNPAKFTKKTVDQSEGLHVGKTHRLNFDTYSSQDCRLYAPQLVDSVEVSNRVNRDFHPNKERKSPPPRTNGANSLHPPPEKVLNFQKRFGPSVFIV